MANYDGNMSRPSEELNKNSWEEKQFSGTTMEKVQAYQFIFRTAILALDPTALIFLGIIIDRSIGWKKTSVALTDREIIEGGNIYQPANFSRDTLRRARQRLMQNDLCEIVRHRDYTIYTPNLDWSPDLHKSETSERLTDVHKSKASGGEICGGRSLNPRHQTPECKALITSNKKQLPLTDRINARERISRVEEGEEKKAERKKALLRKRYDLVKSGKHKGRKIPVQSLAENTWHEAMCEAGGKLVPLTTWTNATWGKAVAMAGDQFRDRPELFYEVLHYSVVNWGTVVWRMKWGTPPRKPNINFWVAAIDSFLNVYAEQKAAEIEEETGDPMIQKKLRLIRIRGFTEEEADEHISRDLVRKKSEAGCEEGRRMNEGDGH